MSKSLLLLFAVLFLHSTLCESQIIQERNVDVFRFTIFEDAKVIYIKALNLQTGYNFGPTKIYPGLNSTAIKNTTGITGNIFIDSIQTTYISVIPPLYSIPVQLNRTEATLTSRELNLIKLQITDLTKENAAIRAENSAIIKQTGGKQYFGKTSPSDWLSDSGASYVVVDISHLNLSNAPHVQVTLHGAYSYSSDWNWGLLVTDLTNISFKVYAQDSPYGYTNGVDWYVLYTITSLDA